VPNADGKLAEVPPMAPPDFTTLTQYRFNVANARDLCREEWTKRGALDKGMFMYCLDREKVGHAELVRTLRKYGKNEWMASLLPAIWLKWTTRGMTKYSMVAYSLREEGDAFLDYQFAQKNASFDAARMSGCESQWEGSDSRWTMTMHCYKG
jgi:hypothetical protein